MMEHFKYLRDKETCLVRFHEMMKTVGANLYLSGLFPFSKLCHETITTDGACLIP